MDGFFGLLGSLSLPATGLLAMSPVDALVRQEQAKNLWGLLSDGSLFGGQTTPGNPQSIDREVQIAGRGQADLTLGNVLSAMGFGLGLASGTGPIKLGAKLALHNMGLIGNPLPQFEGQVTLRPEFKRQIGSRFNTAAEAFRAQIDADRLAAAREMSLRAALSRALGGMATRGVFGGGRGGADGRRAAGGAGAFGGGQKGPGGLLGGAGGV